MVQADSIPEQCALDAGFFVLPADENNLFLEGNQTVIWFQVYGLVRLVHVMRGDHAGRRGGAGQNCAC